MINSEIKQAFANHNLLQYIVNELIEQTHFGRIEWSTKTQGYGWIALVNNCEFFVDAAINSLSAICEYDQDTIYTAIKLGDGQIVEPLVEWLFDYYPLQCNIKLDKNFALLLR